MPNEQFFRQSPVHYRNHRKYTGIIREISHGELYLAWTLGIEPYISNDP